MPNVKVAATIGRGTRIPASEWKLASDLSVEVEHTDEYVIVTNSWLDEYGHGSTKSAAIEDLLTSFVDLYESLYEQQQEAELADELIETLGKLDSLLVRGD